MSGSMEWISVKDRLPKAGQWVLVVYKASIRQCLMMKIAYLQNYFGYADWYPTDATYKTVKGVTHWMPLPELPITSSS